MQGHFHAVFKYTGGIGDIFVCFSLRGIFTSPLRLRPRGLVQYYNGFVFSMQISRWQQEGARNMLGGRRKQS